MIKYILMLCIILTVNLSIYAGDSCFLISHRLIANAEKFHDNEEGRINFSEAFKLSEDYLTTARILYEMYHHDHIVYSSYAGHELLFFILGNSTLRGDGGNEYNKASDTLIELIFSKFKVYKPRESFLMDLILLRQSINVHVGERLDKLGYPDLQEAIEEIQNLRETQ